MSVGANSFRPHLLAGGIALALLLLWGAAMLMVARDAALGPESSGKVLAVFPPALSQEQVLARVVRAGGRPVRTVWPRNVWVVYGAEQGFAGRLGGQGALAVYGEMPLTPTLAGCFAYVDARLPRDPTFSMP